jgi:hypothetical protein
MRSILWLMQKDIGENTNARHVGVEYRKGCPACEHNDPQLELELLAFAQLLFDIYLEKRKKAQGQSPQAGIDNSS